MNFQVLHFKKNKQSDPHCKYRDEEWESPVQSTEKATDSRKYRRAYADHSSIHSHDLYSRLTLEYISNQRMIEGEYTTAAQSL